LAQESGADIADLEVVVGFAMKRAQQRHVDFARRIMYRLIGKSNPRLAAMPVFQLPYEIIGSLESVSSNQLKGIILFSWVPKGA
jgi:hypothetical protein